MVAESGYRDAGLWIVSDLHFGGYGGVKYFLAGLDQGTTSFNGDLFTIYDEYQYVNRTSPSGDPAHLS